MAASRWDSSQGLTAMVVWAWARGAASPPVTASRPMSRHSKSARRAQDDVRVMPGWFMVGVPFCRSLPFIGSSPSGWTAAGPREARAAGRVLEGDAIDSGGSLGSDPWLQAPDFQEGQTQVADDVQEAMQGGLIDDLADQHRLARDLPAQGEAPEPVSPLRSQLTLDANAVASWGRQHGRAPLT